LREAFELKISSMSIASRLRNVLQVLSKIPMMSLSFLLYRIFLLLPIKQTSLFSSYRGNSIDNAIFNLYQAHDVYLKNHTKVLVTNKRRETRNRKDSVHYNSIRYLYLMATSQVLISNIEQPLFFFKRKGQLYIQLWHGTILKKIGLDATYYPYQKRYSKQLKADASKWDVTVSSGEYQNEKLRSTTGIDLQTLQVGNLRIKSRRPEKIEPNQMIKSVEVLYAPTWRSKEDFGNEWFDPILECIDLCRRFPEFNFVLRLHHDLGQIRGSNYPVNLRFSTGDVTAEECFDSADILITDYSSIVFEFLETGKPFFFYIPDIDTFKHYQGIHIDLIDEYPSISATTMSKLSTKLTEVTSGRDCFSIDREKFALNTNNVTYEESIDKVYSTVLNKNSDLNTSPHQNKAFKLLNKFSHTILHFSLLVLGGISQLLVLQFLNENLDLRTFLSVVLIMGLGVLLPFIDFGAYSIALYSFSRSKNATGVQSKMYEPELACLYMLRVASSLTLVSLFLMIFEVSRNVGIYFLLNSISIVGIWVLVIERVQGRVKTALLVQNVQWPLTYAVLKFFELNEVKATIYVAFLPSLITSILVTSFYLLGKRTYLFRMDSQKFVVVNLADRQKWRALKKDALLFTVLALPLPLIFQGDKYILALLIEPQVLNTYAIYMALFSGVLSILWVANSISISDWLKTGRHSVGYIDIRWIGLVSGIGYWLTSPLILDNYFSYSEDIDNLSMLIGVYIFVISVLFRFNLPLSPKVYLRLRIRNLWLHLVSWLILTWASLPIFDVYAPVIIGIAVSIFHIVLVKKFTSHIELRL
jgi:CDP-glycerol glycerophosphotransferase (TagB/SpsB family)